LALYETLYAPLNQAKTTAPYTTLARAIARVATAAPYAAFCAAPTSAG